MRNLKGNVVRLLLLGVIIGIPFVYRAAGKGPDRGSFVTVAAVQESRKTPDMPNREVLTLQESFVRIADRVKPAVVNISTIIEEKRDSVSYEFFFGPQDNPDEAPGDQKPGKKAPVRPRPRKLEGTASGVVIDPSGYILTNEHVVRGAKDIRVTLWDGKKYAGKVVGKDARTDLAIIKIKTNKQLPFARLGDSTRVRVGEWAIAIGSPFGLEETVTTGIVSAVRQSLAIEGRSYRDLIQTDAAINRGNSGGPLINVNGEVIGINTAIYAPTGVFSGIGFAIPINGAKEILNDLMYRGKVVRGWLGVEIRAVDGAIVQHFRLPDERGLLVNNVLKGSPAEKAGLKRGDVIREFDGKPVVDLRAFQAMIAQAGPRRQVRLGIVRDGRAKVISLLTGEMPPDEDEAELPEEPEKESGAQAKDSSSVQWEGLSVITCTDALGRKFGVTAHDKGCLVLSVDPGSIASDMGVLPGDLIRSVNRAITTNAEMFEAVMKNLKAAQGVVFDVSRQGKPLYLSYGNEGNK